MSRVQLFHRRRMAGKATATIFSTIVQAMGSPGKLFCILSPLNYSTVLGFIEVGHCLQVEGIEYGVIVHEGEKMYRLANGARIVCRVSGRH